MLEIYKPHAGFGVVLLCTALQEPSKNASARAVYYTQPSVLTDDSHDHKQVKASQ